MFMVWRENMVLYSFLRNRPGFSALRIFIVLPRPFATSSPHHPQRIRKPCCLRPLLQLQECRWVRWEEWAFSSVLTYFGVRRGKYSVFENVPHVVVSPTDLFPPLLSLCHPAVLQLKLQQRRTREELVSQGIMPRKYHLNFFLLSGHFCHLLVNEGRWFMYGLKHLTLSFCIKNARCESPTPFHQTVF